MSNVVEAPKQPTFLQKASDKVKQTVKCLTDIYFIQISLVKNKTVDQVKTQTTEPNQTLIVTELLEKQYLILKSDDEIDYTKDLKKASQFKLLLATLIVKKLKNLMKDSPNIQIDLVPVSQASFIDEIQNGK
jgi:pheromone shutdown protein TraB